MKVQLKTFCNELLVQDATLCLLREVERKNKNLTRWGTPTRIDLRIFDQEWIPFLSKIPRSFLHHSNSILLKQCQDRGSKRSLWMILGKIWLLLSSTACQCYSNLTPGLRAFWWIPFGRMSGALQAALLLLSSANQERKGGTANKMKKSSWVR